MKVISVKNQVIVENVGTGIIWLVMGISTFLDNGIATILAAICLVCYLIAMGLVIFSKREKADEMSEKHMNKAKKITLDCIMFSTLCFGLVYLILTAGDKTINIDFIHIYYFLISTIQIMIGGIFLFFEKVGD